MRRVLAALPAKLGALEPVRRGLLVLGGRVVLVFAIGALQRNDLSGHDCLYPSNCCGGGPKPAASYLMISLMVPAPTVLPPSRMAKRSPFSIATGVISSMVSATLSPGITISVPSGNSATPVTSVVRK